MQSNPDVPMDRWVEQQMFEEDVRAVMAMLRPHAKERVEGWKEYRTGGALFRATIAWKPEFADDCADGLRVPHMAEVLEAVLVGSASAQDELTVEQEFSLYRQVVRELYHRIDELESRYQ